MECVTINGDVEEVIYSNPDNGYTICDIHTDDNELVTATGTMPGLSEGEHIQLSGTWTTHPDYGEQIKVLEYSVVAPTDEQSILKYLSSGVVPGIRAATAKKLVKAFGADTLNVLLAEPQRVAEIKGISMENANRMSAAYAEMQSMQNIVMFLQRYNVSPSLAVKVQLALGSGAVTLLQANPYLLADRIEGVSFITSDTIANDMGLPKNSPQRICSGIKYILNEAAYSSGHVYLPKRLLLEETVYRLCITEEEAENGLKTLVSNRSVIMDIVEKEDVCYLFSFHEAEAHVAKRLAFISSAVPKHTMTIEAAEKTIDDYEANSDITLAPQQRNAAVTALSSGIMILTGGPGTGKTTTIRTIIKLLNALNLNIALAAPTGRAAKRMSEVTGLEAKTIHRLLGTQMTGGAQVFIHDEEHPLTADVIILDEVSMIDIKLMSSFLRAVKHGARLIFSGDSDQLPSVGAGNVLRDIIESKVVPVIELNKIFRQAEESLIITNAHSINRGELPELKVKTNDFFFLKRTGIEQSAATIVDLYKHRLPKSYGINPISDIQVLSPMKKGVAGTINLNKLIQNSINPPIPGKKEHRYGNTVYRIGDKVMQTRNNYDIPYTRSDGDDGMGIFNGDMGIVADINEHDKYMEIVFDEDKKVEYPFTNLEDIDLAYAITVHKSQGSEFPMVLMPVCSYNPMLMSRNLFYTAVTRARKIVILVGSEKTIANMTYNNTYHERYTGLAEKLISIKNVITAN
ncbi:MAG: ATP-dependent RecD-like DNA helicase [bacterium]|nr:ATP-dependent RecD-like DNA helicase [bacterium]